MPPTTTHPNPPQQHHTSQIPNVQPTPRPPAITLRRPPRLILHLRLGHPLERRNIRALGPRYFISHILLLPSNSLPPHVPHFLTQHIPGLPNPALSDFLAHPTSPPLSPHPNPTPGAPPQGTIAGPGISALPPPLREDGTRRKALVPGCGKGYDVALLASWGFDAYGLEISPTAADKANEYLASNDGGAMEGEYQVKDEGVGRGGMVCLRGDYFEDAWLGDAGAGEEGFDIIYDNTVRFLPFPTPIDQQYQHHQSSSAPSPPPSAPPGPSEPHSSSAPPAH